MGFEREEQLTCEVGKTLEGDSKECQNPVGIRFRGVLLCKRHARELYAKDRVDLWQAMVLRLDTLLEGLDTHEDGDTRRRLELRRAEAVEELELARKGLTFMRPA